MQDQAQSLLGGGVSVAEGHIWGPKAHQPAKRACLPQGLALGTRSAPFTLVSHNKIIIQHKSKLKSIELTKHDTNIKWKEAAFIMVK